MLIDVRNVTEALGGERLIGARVRSLADLNAAVKRGLPKESLKRVAGRVFLEKKSQISWMHTVVPAATLKRRRERLSPAESERTERAARLFAYAAKVWGNDEDARSFLITPHPLLGGQKPLDEAVTELGAREVENILAGIEHGLPV